MSLEAWLTLAAIGATLCTGIIAALGTLQVWLVVQVFALRREVAVLKARLSGRKFSEDTA